MTILKFLPFMFLGLLLNAQADDIAPVAIRIQNNTPDDIIVGTTKDNSIAFKSGERKDIGGFLNEQVKKVEGEFYFYLTIFNARNNDIVGKILINRFSGNKNDLVIKIFKTKKMLAQKTIKSVDIPTNTKTFFITITLYTLNENDEKNIEKNEIDVRFSNKKRSAVSCGSF